MKQLVKGLELDNWEFLNQPGHRKQVEELVEEFHDIFTMEERKVGMVQCAPFNKVKSKKKLIWTEEMEDSFIQIKEAFRDVLGRRYLVLDKKR